MNIDYDIFNILDDIFNILDSIIELKLIDFLLLLYSLVCISTDY